MQTEPVQMLISKHVPRALQLEIHLQKISDIFTYFLIESL